MKDEILNYEEKIKYFNAFIEEYKEKSLLEKQLLIIGDLKEIIALIQKLCIDNDLNYDLLINREITDINRENYTDDDLMEAIYVYIQIFKDALANYLLKTNKFDNKD